MRLPPDTAVPNRERTRRVLVRLIFVFYVALLGEGALRKWLLPDASNALIFLRDPVMVLILALYLGRGPAPDSRVPLACVAGLLLALVFCAGCQAITSEVPAPVLLAGLRNFVLFVPLCFAIRDSFGPADYRVWIKLNLTLALPIAALVGAQYVSSPAALVNAVPGGGNDGVFMLVDDVVRPYGLFSFVLGHSAYAAWMVGVALAALLGRRAFGFGYLLIGAGVIGIAVMGLLSGSRTYFLFAAAGLATFGFTAAAFGTGQARRTGLSSIVVMIAVVLAAVVLMPWILDDLVERQGMAFRSEGALGDRVVQVATEFLGEIGHIPLFGQGLGAGTNIAAYLGTGSTDHVLAEYELTRIVQELGPIFGLGYILLRWGFLAWVALQSGKAATRGNLQPACFLGFLIPVFLAHDITLQNSMIGIGWFSAGIALSAARVGPRLAPHRSRPLPLHIAGVQA